VLNLAKELEVQLDDRLIALAVRQYLENLKRVRAYKRRMREDPATRDSWYAKRREDQKERRRKETPKLATEDELRERRFAMIRERAEAQ